jgi:hypothetical protein
MTWIHTPNNNDIEMADLALEGFWPLMRMTMTPRRRFAVHLFSTSEPTKYEPQPSYRIVAKELCTIILYGIYRAWILKLDSFLSDSGGLGFDPAYETVDFPSTSRRPVETLSSSNSDGDRKPIHGQRLEVQNTLMSEGINARIWGDCKG